ncbi:MAG: methionyl-tRNA formyltransferase [Gammaproteobacteria bacterium]
MRLAFAGTPEFAAVALRALLARDEFQIAAVYTQPDRPAGRGRQLTPSAVKQVALERGLSVRQPLTLRSESEQARLRDLTLDVLVVVAYGLILPQEVLAAPRRGCVNLHASLLPRWRGAAPIERAILAGDTHTGVSFMLIEPELDSGPVIATVDCPIEATDTAGDLHARLAQLGAGLLCRKLAPWVRGEIETVAQNHSEATYAAKITKAETMLDWSAPAMTLARQVRAFNPRWGAVATLAGEQVKIWTAEIGTSVNTHSPGAIVRAKEGVLEVATGEGTLRLLIVQAPGKRPVSAADFINARPRLGGNA